MDEGCAGFDIAWSGKEVVMTGLYTQGGETFAWTEVFAFDTPSSFTQTLQIGSPGALKPGSTIRGTRRE